MKSRVNRETRAFVTPAELKAGFELRPDEQAFFERAPGPAETKDPEGAPVLPLKVTPYYLELAAGEEGIRRQCIPSIRELEVKPCEHTDPLHEHRFSPVPRLVHRYPDRVLLLAADSCAVNCRHCFRRYLTAAAGSLPGDGPGMSGEELAAAEDWLNAHPGIREVIISGGDPLTLDAARLFAVVRAAAGDGEPRRRTVRIASRMPVVAPDRITPELAAGLKAAGAAWFVTQFNHPAELTREGLAAVGRITDAGVPVLNQTVLLKGVNDRPEVLAELFTGIVAAQVKPYYLFQGDLAAGTSHLRVNLQRGLDMVQELRRRVSGLAMPVYAVDLPEGGGKVPLNDCSIIGTEEDRYLLEGPGGRVYRYPAE